MEQVNFEVPDDEVAVDSVAHIHRWAAVKEVGMKILFIIAAAIFIAAVVVICVYLFVGSVPAIAEIGFFEFLFGDRWIPGSGLYGIGSLIVGTIYSTAGALVIGVPIGVLVAVFMAFYCPKWLYKILKPAMNILAGIPSIVYGYFGLSVIVPLVREWFGGSGLSLLATIFILGVMILPTIISITETSLRAVPKSYYEGALALGATKERAIFRTIFPAAKSGIVTAIILGLGRAFGETAAVTLICGNSASMPTSLIDPLRTLASNIANDIGYGYSNDLTLGLLIGCALVLFVFILLITIIVMLLKKRSR